MAHRHTRCRHVRSTDRSNSPRRLRVVRAWRTTCATHAARRVMGRRHRHAATWQRAQQTLERLRNRRRSRRTWRRASVVVRGGLWFAPSCGARTPPAWPRVARARRAPTRWAGPVAQCAIAPTGAHCARRPPPLDTAHRRHVPWLAHQRCAPCVPQARLPHRCATEPPRPLPRRWRAARRGGTMVRVVVSWQWIAPRRTPSRAPRRRRAHPTHRTGPTPAVRVGRARTVRRCAKRMWVRRPRSLESVRLQTNTAVVGGPFHENVAPDGDNFVPMCVAAWAHT